MGDLRIKARELLQFNQDRNTYSKKLTKDTNKREKRMESIQKFTEKMRREIEEFQDNLLQSANWGRDTKNRYNSIG